MCTQIMVMVIVRSMKNVHVVNIMSQYSIIGILHALVSSRVVCKIIAIDSDLNWRKVK